MDLELTDEQKHLESVAGQVLGAYAPLDLARSFLDGEGDPSELWAELAELGWYAVGAEDGDGVGVPGLALLSRAIGRQAAPTLIADTVVTARIVASGGGEEVHSTWFDRLTAGGCPTSLAILDGAGSWDPSQVVSEAAGDGNGGYVVNGVKLGVQHGRGAKAFAVLASVDGAAGLFLVRPDAPGVTIELERSLDPATAACTVALTDVAVGIEDSIVGPAGREAVERGLRVGAVAAAAEALGAASRTLDLAVEYALGRRQYGQAIGSFQALQHLLAELHVLRETSWSTVLYAAAAIDQGTEDADEAAAIAKAHASRAARRVAEGALQAFGGVAFTWEHDFHLLARRVMVNEQRFGDSLHHERRLADSLAGDPVAVA